MKTGLYQLIERAFRREPALHPLDCKLARHWIKQRLATIFPELRNNPTALEKAYHSLNLQPRPGLEEGEAATVFEMSIPEGDARER